MARKGRIEKFPIGPVLEALGWELPGGRRTGRVKAKCAFHDDRVASAVIDYTSQRLRCFGCGETGDAIELVMRHEGLGFEAAIDRCATTTGQTKPAVRGEPDGGRGLFDGAGYSD